MRAIVIGHNFTSLLGLIRALGKMEYEVGVIRTGKPAKRNIWNMLPSPEKKSKYVYKYISVDSKDEIQVINILKTEFSLQNEKPIIIPTDDITAEIIDKYVDELKELFFMPNVQGRSGGVIELMDKMYQKELAKKAGLLVANGWSVEIVNGKYEIPANVSFPCFVKPETPILKRKQYMKCCKDKNELQALFESVAKYKDCKMLVEEYIEIDREYSVVGLCNNEKVCIPAYIDMVVGGSGSHAGVTACGKLYTPDKFEEVTKNLKLMLSEMNFQGIFGVDLYESKGNMYFCEFNTRMGASGVAVLLGGVNIADMFAKTFTDSVDDLDFDSICKEITFVNDKTCINDYGNGYINWKEYKRRVKETDYRFIYSEDDKVPYYLYGIDVLKYKIKNLKKK